MHSPDTLRSPQTIQDAVLHHQAGRLRQAEEIYRRILHAEPQHVDALHLLGLVACQRGNGAAAVELIGKAIRLNPSAPMLFNLGYAWQAQGRFDEAAESYRRALALQPDYAEACNNLGFTLHCQGRLDEAASSYQRALALRPAYTEALVNLGNVLKTQGRLADAIECYRQALALEPDDAQAYNNLGATYLDQGELDKALASYRQALALAPDFTEANSNLLFAMNFDPACEPGQYLASAIDYGRKVSAKATPWTQWPACTQAGRTAIRVGLVSGDFRTHAAGHFLESVLAQLNPARIELIAYSTQREEDALTARIKPRFAAWRSIAGLGDQAAAQVIHRDGVQILVDLAGHTSGNRLPVFAWKPAPIQVAWLGYFASTGLAAIDYILCDSDGVPAGEHHRFTETPWLLPDTRLCFTPPEAEIAAGPLPAPANGAVTFGCFNNLAKMNDEVVTLWARVLHAVADSRLMLKSRQLNDAAMRTLTISRFAAAGIESARLMLEGFSSREDYLKAYHRIDIALDPFPYTGGTTSVEGLWMGVPFITRRGDRLLARQGEGMLRAVGLPDWIAADNDDYVALAAKRASNLAPLASLRSGLRARLLASPLCDAPRFAENLEQAFERMWQQRCG